MARPPRQRLPRLPSQPWRVGDRFELRYDYRTEGLSLQAGALGTITLLPAPPTSAAYVVFDSEPTHAPVPVARAALARIARPPRPNPSRRTARAKRIARDAIAYPLDPPGYAERVRELEAEGLTTSDAQGVADAESRKYQQTPAVIAAARRVASAIPALARERAFKRLEARLNDGTVVLGRLYKGEVVPLHYSNRTQAARAAALVDGEVIQRGRPFYVRLAGAAPVTRANPQWLNSPEAYENAGMEAGRSVRHGDVASWRQWKDWMTRAIKLERAENRAEAQAIYTAAYKKAAVARGPISNPAKRKAPRAAAASRPVRVARRELNAAVELFYKFREAPPRRVRLARFKVPKVCVVIGEMDFVGYTTTHARKRARYRHDFSRKARPLLCASSDGRQLLIFGGNYDFTRDGIVDRA